MITRAASTIPSKITATAQIRRSTGLIVIMLRDHELRVTIFTQLKGVHHLHLHLNLKRTDPELSFFCAEDGVRVLVIETKVTKIKISGQWSSTLLSKKVKLVDIWCVCL